MIQDIYPYVYDNTYKIKQPEKDSFLMFVRGRDVLIKEGEEFLFPTADLLGYTPRDCTYLFSISGKEFYMTDESSEELEKSGYTYVAQGTAGRLSPRWKAYGATVAVDLVNWYRQNRYCGRCGHELEKSDKERMLHCSQCGNMIYPRINPVVIVAVKNGNKLLLTQYAGRKTSNHYALVAGFAEIGESIEDTVRREVKEETGVNVKNIKFYKSQPWPMSGSLLSGFVCELDGSDEIKIQEDELGFAGWIERDEIPDNGDTVSLTSEMIRMFREGNI